MYSGLNCDKCVKGDTAKIMNVIANCVEDYNIITAVSHP